MAANVPDDWGLWSRRCADCGARWHASEGGHDCPEAPHDADCACADCEQRRDDDAEVRAVRARMRVVYLLARTEGRRVVLAGLGWNEPTPHAALAGWRVVVSALGESAIDALHAMWRRLAAMGGTPEVQALPAEVLRRVSEYMLEVAA